MLRVAPRKLNKCLFCGQRADSGEHMFPKWAHQYLPRTMKKYRTLVVDAHPHRTRFRLGKKMGDILDWKTPSVCQTCNNGWMSQLETQAKPIVTALIKGEHRRLTVHDQEIIAAWASVKVMAAEGDYFAYITTHHSHRKRLRAIRRPPPRGWRIVIGNFKRTVMAPCWWSAHPFSVASSRSSKELGHPATSFNSQASTYVIGQLFIQILRSPMEIFVRKFRYPEPAAANLRQIWPPAGFGIIWPPPTALSDTSAVQISEAVFRWLMGIADRKLAGVTPVATPALPPWKN